MPCAPLQSHIVQVIIFSHDRESAWLPPLGLAWLSEKTVTKQLRIEMIMTKMEVHKRHISTGEYDGNCKYSGKHRYGTLTA